MKTLGLLFLQLVIAFGINAQSIYDFTVKDISGEDFKLAELKGKRVMVVNTASKCGLTGQYENLQALYQEYKDQDFVIIGFPANNFMKQEPGTNEEIQSFCKMNYGVDFPMMSKISVKGDDIHPLYQYLTSSTDSKVKWNFQKYLIDKDGTIDGVVPPATKPDEANIKAWIETGDFKEE